MPCGDLLDWWLLFLVVVVLLWTICSLIMWGSPRDDEEVVNGIGLVFCLDGIGVGLLVCSTILLSGGGLDGPGVGSVLIPLRFAYNEGLSLSSVSH